jgi:4-coumarate--CoA ligase
MMPNNPTYMVALTGASGVGLIVTTVNPGYTVSEVARQLTMSKSKAILTTAVLLPLVNKAIEKSGKLFSTQIIVQFTESTKYGQ